MGCDCCKIADPSTYAKCQDLRASLEKKHRSATAPCGGCEIGFTTRAGGSRFTPPKKKRKKKNR